MDLINQKYLMLLDLIIQKNPDNQSGILEQIAELDCEFPSNQQRHEDFKRDYVYVHPGNDFILTETVNGLLGKAFVDYSLDVFAKQTANDQHKRFISNGHADFAKKAANAIQSYATTCPHYERLLFIYDDTIFGSGKEGFLIGEKYLYGAGYQIRVDDVKQITFSFKSNVLYVQLNEEKVQALSMIDKTSTETFQSLLFDIFQIKDEAREVVYPEPDASKINVDQISAQTKAKIQDITSKFSNFFKK
jgi:hypothetical protein